MDDAVARLLIVIDASTEQLRRELAKADKMVADSSTKMDKALAAMGKGWKSADGWVKKHNTELKLLGAAAVGAMGLAIKGIADYSDTFKNLQGQLKLVTDSQDDLNSVWEQSLRIANSTGSSLDATVTLYSRMARATEELGIGQSDLLQMTETINQAFVVSGATAAEASAAIVQLSQGMAKGRLDGQELNAVLEQSPRLARLIADEMEVAIGALKDLGAEGEITSDVMVSAFKNGAEDIRQEFELMPVTVERAMNQVSNNLTNALGRADLSPLVESIQQFADILTDPQVISGLTHLASSLVSIANGALQAAAALPNVTRFLAEGVASAGFGPAADDMDRMATAIERLNNEQAHLEMQGATASPQYQQNAAELQKLSSVYDLQLELINNTANARQDDADAAAEHTQRMAPYNARIKEARELVKGANQELDEHIKHLIDSADAAEEHEKRMKGMNSRYEQATKSIQSSHEALDEMRRSTKNYLDDLDFERELLGKSAREQEILTALRKDGARATDEERRQIRERVGALYDETEATEKATKAKEDAAERLANAFTESRGLLSDFFFEFASDGKNAFDTLVKGFKAMIAKMIAEAAASGIFKLFAGIAGGLGFSGVANAAAGAAGGNLLTSAIGGISGLFTGGGGGLQPIVTNVAQGLAPASGAAISAGASVGGAGFSAAGLATSLGIGAAVVGGGMILNKMFGEKNNGNNAGIANLNLASGTINASGSGKSFDQANVDRASQLAQELLNFATGIGGSNANLEVVYGNRSGAQLNGKKYGQDLDAFFADAFEIIIENATDLNGSLKALALGFKGTSEELFGFTSSMASIGGMIKANPVDVAVKDFADAQKAASSGITQSYRDQLIQIADLIRGYDGSSDAAIELNAALVTNKQTAYQLTMQLQQMAESVTGMLLDSAQDIRDSQLTPEQLKKKRVAEKTALRASLWTIQDPAELAKVAGEVNSLNNLLFQSLTPEQQAGQAEAYAEYAERTADIVQKRSDKLVEKLGLSQGALNDQIKGIYDDFGLSMNAIGDKFNTAADKILRAADRFSPYDGEIS